MYVAELTGLLVVARDQCWTITIAGEQSGLLLDGGEAAVTNGC